LGLQVAEVERLVTMCPVSCKIDCGSLVKFEVKVTFQLQNVASKFLSPESAEKMELAGMEHLSAIIYNADTKSEFFLYQAQLLSQQLFENDDESDIDGSKNRRSIRRLQSSSYDLLVQVAFRGYAIDITYQYARENILKGIESTGYTRAIQRSGGSELENAVVSTKIDPDTYIPPSNNPEQNRSRGMSPGGVAAVVIVCLFVVAASVVLVWYKTLRGKIIIWNGKPIMLGINSFKKRHPRASGPISSPRSPLSNVLSFENIVRMVSSPRSRDSNATPGSDDTVPMGDIPEDCFSENGGYYSAEDGKRSEMGETAENEEDEEEEEHPYTGIIPPMIVIDHIDDEEEEDDVAMRPIERVKNVVPSRHVSAPAHFLEALKSHTMEQSTPPGVYFNEDAFPTLPPNSALPLLRFGLDVEHDMLLTTSSHYEAGSSPQHDHHLDIRTALSDSEAVSAVDVNSPMSRISSFSRDARASSSTSWESRRIREEAYLSEEDDIIRTISDATTVRAGPEDPMPDRDEPIEEIPAAKDGTKFFGNLWSLSPVRRMRSNPLPSELEQAHFHFSEQSQMLSAPLPPVNPKKTTRNSSSSSELNTYRSAPLHSRNVSKSSSSSSELEMTDGEVQLVFQAPRKGKLGLVIQCMEDVGPVVVNVKGYSPLLGQVQPGDRLVNVDGVKTSHMTLSEVTTLLSGKQLSRSRWTSTLRIVVVRTRMNNEPLPANDAVFCSPATTQKSLSSYAEQGQLEETMPMGYEER